MLAQLRSGGRPWQITNHTVRTVRSSLRAQPSGYIKWMFIVGIDNDSDFCSA